MNFSILFVLGCVLAYASGSPLKTESLKFKIENEWNLVPDSNGRLTMMHRDEIHSTEPEGRFTAESDVIFLLFTRDNPDGEPIQLENLDSLKSTKFNPAHQTRFTIHGWNSGIDSGTNTAPRKSFFEIGEFNVIVVDWSAGSNSLTYVTSRNRVEEVGGVVARFIDFLVTDTEQRLDQIQLAGHSLGAHVAGFAGKQVKVGKIHTIIAMDPASPLFSATDSTARVDASDAEYVEHIVSSGALVGLMDPIGTATFYPNGGRSQPGCGLDVTGSCAHSRAPELFGESISSKVGFWASQCESINNMSIENCNGPRFALGGEPSLHGSGAEGIFYFETGDSSPFAFGY